MVSVNDLMGMDDKKLAETLTEQRKDLFDMRFKHATAQLDNTQALPETKKTIARILTIQRERAMGAK